jgi:hypothetical protein
MEKKITITYRWWINEGTDEIPTEHHAQLEEAAESRINEMRPDGYTEGELHQEIEGKYYDGYWEMTTETV